MSGLFKNYSKFVSASVFSSPNKLIINPTRWTFNSANIFYNPAYRYTGLPKSHEYSAFALAQIASALTHEAQQFNSIDCLKEEAQLNYQFAAQCAQEAINFIKNNQWNEEVETTAQLLYTIQNNHLLQISKDVLLPNLIKNAKYLSTQNIIDTVISLQDLQDATFWQQFFEGIKDKQLSWEFQTIEYHGWETQQFDYVDNVKQQFRLTNTWATLQSQDSQLKRFVLEGILFAYTHLYLPVLGREKRIRYIFNDRLYERTSFKNALKKVNEIYNVQSWIARA